VAEYDSALSTVFRGHRRQWPFEVVGVGGSYQLANDPCSNVLAGLRVSEIVDENICGQARPRGPDKLRLHGNECTLLFGTGN
jgi:hypothetical protein